MVNEGVASLSKSMGEHNPIGPTAGDVAQGANTEAIDDNEDAKGTIEAGNVGFGYEDD